MIYWCWTFWIIRNHFVQIYHSQKQFLVDSHSSCWWYSLYCWSLNDEIRSNWNTAECLNLRERNNVPILYTLFNFHYCFEWWTATTTINSCWSISIRFNVRCFDKSIDVILPLRILLNLFNSPIRFEIRNLNFAISYFCCYFISYLCWIFHWISPSMF